MSWPWETRTSTCLNFATISSGLYRFLAIAVLLDVETYLKSDHFVGGGSTSFHHLSGDSHLQRSLATGPIAASNPFWREWFMTQACRAKSWPPSHRACRSLR